MIATCTARMTDIQARESLRYSWNVVLEIRIPW
jgi:hypothetical protein